jgi:hypothetical protein
VVATLSQLANGADRLFAGSGQIVFLILLAAFIVLASTPIILYLRLPEHLSPPENESGPELLKYQQWQLLALRLNRNLEPNLLAEVSDIPKALAKLSIQADSKIKNAANAIFVSTAVMQNGKLDGLIMLFTQAKLVWNVATIYHLRPSPRQLIYLYSNVGAAMLVAENLDDIDFAEIASPIVTSVAPSLAGAVPGLQGVASLLTNSLANGAANAFLTLRVGLLAKAYCAPQSKPDSKKTRASATSQAFSLVGEIVKTNGAKVMKAVWGGISSPLAGATESVISSVKSATVKVGDAASATAESVSNAIKATGAQVKDGASSVANTTSDVGRAIGSAAGSGIDTLLAGTVSLAESTKEASKSIGQATSSMASNLVAATGSTMNSAWSATTDSVKGGAGAVASGTAGLGKAIGRAADATADGAKNVASKATQATNSILGRNA